MSMRTKSFSRLAAVSTAGLCAAVAGLLVVPQTAYEGRTISVIYTGDTNGELESCG